MRQQIIPKESKNAIKIFKNYTLGQLYYRTFCLSTYTIKKCLSPKRKATTLVDLREGYANPILARRARSWARSRRFGNQKKTDHRMMVCFLLAAELGFEPRHTESESAVLPLHNSAILNLMRFEQVGFSIRTYRVCRSGQVCDKRSARC